MSVPAVAKATLQAAVINAGSNVLAQAINSFQDKRPFELDAQTLMQFTTCAFVLSPLGFWWLESLESWFPGSTQPSSKAQQEKVSRDEQSESQSPAPNITNIVTKIVIDQTIGGAWNTVLFIVTMGMLRGLSYDTILEQICQDFWPIMIAGFKLWPFVSVLNFTVIPASQRLLVSSLFGVVWAIYLSLMSDERKTLS